MWKKCLMLSLVLTAIFTVKSLAFDNTYKTLPNYYNNIYFGYHYDDFNQNDLLIYNIFQRSGNTKNSYQLLYNNPDTKELIFFVMPDFYTNTSNLQVTRYILYIRENIGYGLTLIHENGSWQNFADGNGFVLFKTSNNYISEISYYGVCSYDFPNNHVLWDEDFNIYSKSDYSNFCTWYDINRIVSFNEGTKDYGSNSGSYNDSWIRQTRLSSGEHSILEFLPDYNINDYNVIPICSNLFNSYNSYSADFYSLTNNYSSYFPNNFAEYYSQVAFSIINSNNNINKVLLWDSLNGINNNSSNENIILHVEDSNLRNIFEFNFQLPKHKEDSVYYGFMNNYTRNSYNSVSANFTIYELWTPPEYTGSFDKYMIYDEEGKYFTFVNGLFVNAYTGSCDSGGNFNFETTEININNTIVNDYIATITDYQMFNLENDGNFVRPSTTVLGIGVNSLQSLGRHLINNLFSGVIGRIGLKPSQEITASSLKKLLYYSNYIIYNGTEFDNTNYYRLNDCCFATGNIYAYENTYSSKVFESDFYNLIRNTIVRDSSKFKLTDGEYLITKVDGQNVSSLLPSGTDTTYLNSPIFRNTDSINGGYLLSNVEDIINGQKPINYNVEYSPIYNTYNENYIQNYNDNLSPENEDYINSTDSDSKLIQKFISYLKSIDDKLDNLKINVSNTTNSFTTSFQNFYSIDKLALKDTTDSFIDTFNDSMGIIADIPTMALYFLGRFSNLNNGAITLVIPRLEIFDAVLLEQTTINFTDLINSNQTFIYLHNIALICTDVILLSILLQLAKNAFEEVKR